MFRVPGKGYMKLNPPNYHWYGSGAHVVALPCPGGWFGDMEAVLPRGFLVEHLLRSSYRGELSEFDKKMGEVCKSLLDTEVQDKLPLWGEETGWKNALWISLTCIFLSPPQKSQTHQYWAAIYWNWLSFRHLVVVEGQQIPVLMAAMVDNHGSCWTCFLPGSSIRIPSSISMIARIVIWTLLHEHSLKQELFLYLHMKIPG